MKFDEIESLIAPLLAAVPATEAQWLASLFRAPTTHETFTALDNELFIRDDRVASPLLVASATRGEGRTTIALLLAVLTSVLDPSRQVLLVDGDIDNGKLAATLGIHASKAGLGEFFDGKASVAECIHATAIANLSVVPVAAGAGASIRLSPKGFEKFMAGVPENFDLIIVDSAAGGPNKGILSMASVVRNALLIVKYGGPTREQVATLLGDINRAGAQVIGCLINQREYVVPHFLYGHR